jgi:hypothetical protein
VIGSSSVVPARARKISGFRTPAWHNAEASGNAVDAAATTLLDHLEVRSAPRR